MSQVEKVDAPRPPSLGGWGEIVLTVLLFLVCTGAAWIVFRLFGPAWGLPASVGAFWLWARLGPPAFPGLLPGCLAMGVLFSNAGCGVAAVVALLHPYVHHAP